MNAISAYSLRTFILSLYKHVQREREREEERARYTYIAVVGSIDLCLGDFWSLCCACVVVSHILTILFVQPLHQISVRLKNKSHCPYNI